MVIDEAPPELPQEFKVQWVTDGHLARAKEAAKVEKSLGKGTQLGHVKPGFVLALAAQIRWVIKDAPVIASRACREERSKGIGLIGLDGSLATLLKKKVIDGPISKTHH